MQQLVIQFKLKRQAGMRQNILKRMITHIFQTFSPMIIVLENHMEQLYHFILIKHCYYQTYTHDTKEEQSKLTLKRVRNGAPPAP